MADSDVVKPPARFDLDMRSSSSYFCRASLTYCGPGTEILENKEGTLSKDCLLVNVRLPLSPDKIQLGEQEPLLVVQWGQKTTMEYDTFIPFFWHAGGWWVRLSAQVYLDLSDFERAATVITSVCERIRTGEHVP